MVTDTVGRNNTSPSKVTGSNPEGWVERVLPGAQMGPTSATFGWATGIEPERIWDECGTSNRRRLGLQLVANAANGDTGTL